MKIIYIAGPYNAKSQWEVVQNIRAAEQAAIFVWQHGAAAMCPHTNSAFLEGIPGVREHVWISGYSEILIRCDAVFAIRGWRESNGAMSDVDIARMNNIPVLFTYNDVIQFIQREASNE